MFTLGSMIVSHSSIGKNNKGLYIYSGLMAGQHRINLISDLCLIANAIVQDK